jgi:hypothetical protein
MAERERPTPEEEIRRLYGEAEASAAKAAERVVSRDSFGELLAMMTENVVALTRIANEALDMTLRNLRLASRRDLIDLGRQIGRTEDKLEHVLREVEGLRDRFDAREGESGDGASPANATRAASGGNRRREAPDT